MNPPVGIQLEVICCSAEDAIAACEGGATRLELTVRLDDGGLTPPLEMVRVIQQSLPAHYRVMLRERADFAVGGVAELENLKRLARQFAGLGVDGLVTGFAADGALDLAALRAILSETPETHFTIHHAIEATADPSSALRAVCEFTNADRCLVHGGTGTPRQRIARLLEYRKALGPERTPILGGRVTLETLEEFARGTQFTEFHLGRAVRTPETAAGRVDPDKVKRALGILRSSDQG